MLHVSLVEKNALARTRITSFFRAPMRFQVLSQLKFISQKNFDFICQNRPFLRRAQTHKKTHEKKNQDNIFFPCAYAFLSPKIHFKT